MTSKTTMRREVRKAGGYYNSSARLWVLPGASHNCTPWANHTQWFATLEEAYEAAPAALDANREVHEFGRREARYLAAHR